MEAILIHSKYPGNVQIIVKSSDPLKRFVVLEKFSFGDDIFTTNFDQRWEFSESIGKIVSTVFEFLDDKNNNFILIFVSF